MSLSEHAREQAALWGTDPRGWLELAEPHNVPLFRAVLSAAGVRSGTRLLDVGCGTGGTLVLAREAGAVVSGLDVAEPLLDLARARLPEAELVSGELDSLPFADRSFDAVVGVNAFQFAADPTRAFGEVRRVLVPGGRVVASLFAAPERSESTVIHEALSSLIRSTATAIVHAPYLLSQPGNLEAGLEAAGFDLLDSGEVACTWHYADVASTVRGILASAGGASAIAAAGREQSAETIASAVARYTGDDGAVTMHNTFRWVSAASRDV